MSEVFQEGSVRGYLHRPEGKARGALVVTHGAGGNAKMPLLVAAGDAFAAAGFLVLRCDLAFRIKRASGGPHPSGAAADRAGLQDAVAAVRKMVAGKVLLGGQSYGGRQATMLAAEQPDVADGLVLFSYPLHPPGKPEQLRTAHFTALRTPVLFIHGTRDPFGSIEEMRPAIGLIPSPTVLDPVERAGHDLLRGKLDWPRVISLAESLLEPR